jgi:hypothetical protein
MFALGRKSDEAVLWPAPLTRFCVFFHMLAQFGPQFG